MGFNSCIRDDDCVALVFSISSDQNFRYRPWYLWFYRDKNIIRILNFAAALLLMNMLSDSMFCWMKIIPEKNLIDFNWWKLGLKWMKRVLGLFNWIVWKLGQTKRKKMFGNIRIELNVNEIEFRFEKKRHIQWKLNCDCGAWRTEAVSKRFEKIL